MSKSAETRPFCLKHGDGHWTKDCEQRDGITRTHLGTGEGETLRRHFEANMLDGESVDDCGGAMLSAKSVLEYMEEYTTLATKEKL